MRSKILANEFHHPLIKKRELSQAELKKYEHKKEAVKELRKAYLDEKRRGIESREDVTCLCRF